MRRGRLRPVAQRTGRDRYQQMTAMSVTLRQIASSQNIVLLALCQMNRAIEGRTEFIPQLNDLKETGQLEQDADVIVFLCWPHKEIVVRRFVPDRQQIHDLVPEYNPQTGQWET